MAKTKIELIRGEMAVRSARSYRVKMARNVLCNVEDWSKRPAPPLIQSDTLR